MWIRLIRTWIQIGIWLGRRKQSEPLFKVCVLESVNYEKQKEFIDRIWKMLWDDGWSVLLTGYSFYGQVLQMRKVFDNHQYHLRMIHQKKQEAGCYDIEIHYEAKWECHYEHSHEIDLRPLTREEAQEIIILLA